MSNYDYRPELEEINRKERHKESLSYNQALHPVSICYNCGQNWPCETEKERKNLENNRISEARKLPVC